MTTFSSPPSWSPDVQFAIGACLGLVRYLVQHFIGFSEMEAGRALMIGNLLPALDTFLTAFGGIVGTGSTPLVLLLDPVRRGDMAVNSFVSPAFGLPGGVWKASMISQGDSVGSTGSISPSTQSHVDLQAGTTMYICSAAGCMVLAMLIGVWIVLGRTEAGANTGTRVNGVVLTSSTSPEERSEVESGNGNFPGKGNVPFRRRQDSTGGHRYPEPHDDDNHLDDSDSDSGDDDPPPPPPGSGLYHEDDSTDWIETFGWKFGVNFLLGSLVATLLKGLQKLKTIVDAQRRNTSAVDEQTGGTDYGNEWDVLDGACGFSRSKRNIDIASRSKLAPGGRHIFDPLTKLATQLRLMLGAAPFNKDLTLLPASILAWMGSAVAQNQTISSVFFAHSPRRKIDWIKLKVRAMVKKARARSDLTQTMATIRVCLEVFFETFGLLDIVVLVVIPLTSSILRYRYDEQDDTGVEVGDSSEEQHQPGHELLDEANEDATRMVADPVNCDGSFSLDTSLDYAAAQTPSGYRDTPQAADPGRDSERRTSTTSDTEGNSSIQDEGADGEALPNDLNDAESFAASGGSDAEMEVTRDIRDERFVEDINGQDAVCFYEAQENVRYINESNEDSVILFQASFQPLLLEAPLWATRSSESEAVDYSLLNVETQASEDMETAFRTPPQAIPKTLPSTPPAVPRGRKIRLKEKLLKEKERREGKEDDGRASPTLGLVGAEVGELALG